MDIRKEKPKKDNHEFYGTNYSVPVLIQKIGIITHLVRWDFIRNGWIEYTFYEGFKPEDYDYGDDWYDWEYLPIFT